MKDLQNVSPVFCNLVAGRGCLNGVVNVTMATHLFTPNEVTGGVDMDTVVSLRMRMDVPCARQLYNELGSLLADIGAIDVAQPPEDTLADLSPPPNGKVN